MAGYDENENCKPYETFCLRRPSALGRLDCLHTFFRTPATELLIEIVSASTISQLDIGQPLRHNVEERRIQPNRSTDNRHDQPGLPGVIRLPHFASPTERPLLIPEARPFSSFRASPRLFMQGILNPVYRGEVLVSLDLVDLLVDYCRGVVAFGGRSALVYR